MGFHSMKFCVVGVTNGVPTVQNVKSTYKTLALIANWATEDQDQDVHEEICRLAKADNIMIDEYEI